MESLKERKCVPCEGGIRPLDAGQAAGLMKLLHADWQLVEDGQGHPPRSSSSRISGAP